jgi:hypothetical protein
MRSIILDRTYAHHLTFIMAILELKKSMVCVIVRPRAVLFFRFKEVNQKAPNGGWQLLQSI